MKKMRPLKLLLMFALFATVSGSLIPPALAMKAVCKCNADACVCLVRNGDCVCEHGVCPDRSL